MPIYDGPFIQIIHTITYIQYLTYQRMTPLKGVSLFGILPKYIPQAISMVLFPDSKKKIPHTGDTESLDRCGS